jgi:hypothetical protein
LVHCQWREGQVTVTGVFRCALIIHDEMYAISLVDFLLLGIPPWHIYIKFRVLHSVNPFAYISIINICLMCVVLQRRSR